MAYFAFLKIFLICLFLGQPTSSTAAGADLITSRGLLEDRHGTLDIDAVIRSEFEEVGPIVAKGFTDSVHWLRITVRVPQRGGAFELRIRPTFLDEVLLYEPDPAQPGEWKQRATGDRHGDQAERPGTALGFTLVPQGEETTYYLRLKTTSSSLINVEAFDPASARNSDLHHQFLHLGYLCIMLSMAVLAVHELITLRSRLTAFFLAYLAIQVAQSTAVRGYLPHFLPAELAHLGNVLTSIFVLATIAAGGLFYRQLFRAYGATGIGLRLLEGALLLFPIELALMAFDHARLALQINAFVVQLLGLLLPCIALSMRSGPMRERRIIRWLVSVQAVAVTMTMAPLLGLIEPKVEWVLNVALTHGLITSAVMYVILHFRALGLIDLRHKIEMELALAKRTLDAERRRSSEQARFMDMLTHELKTPLAAVKMVFGMPNASDSAKQYALKALDDMDAVVERCRQMDQLEQGMFVPRCELCQVDVVLAEVVAAYQSPARVRITAEALPAVESDRHLLKIILGNLVDNALKYSAADSDIQVRIDRHNADSRPHIRISIENLPGSAGLPDPDRVFEKYYRTPHAHKYTGSGLGLYLVRNLAELLSGRMTYEQIHHHVRFTLWIPV